MRIPQELKDALDAASAENKRSLTAEVVARLEATFATEAPTLNLRVTSPILRVSPDGSSREITVEELARALAAEIKKPTA